jgi:cytochrome P450
MALDFITDETERRLTSRRDPDGLVGPGPDLTHARESGAWPVFEYREPGVHTTVDQASAISAYPDVRELLSHPAIVNGEAALNVEGSRAQQPGNLLFKNGDEHRRLRMLLIRHFTVKRVAAMRPRVEQIVDRLLADVEASGSPVDLVPVFTSPLPALVFCELMGVPYEEHSKVLRWTETLVSLEVTTEENHAAAAAIRGWMTDLVRSVTANPGSDLMSAIVADGGDDLSEEEAVGLGTILMSGGFDTTSHSTALSILSLLQLPDQLAIVRERGGLTERDADEVIRYLTPVPAPRLRLASQDITIGQNSVKAGDRVMVSLLGANWDPALVGDKPQLDLTRPRTSHVGFGYGAHQCPGQHLARLEMSVAVTKIFDRFPTLRLDGDPRDFSWRSKALIYGIGRLPVAW